MAPAPEDLCDIEFVPVVFKQIDAFTDCLKHAEFDSVVDKFGEVSGTRWASMNIAALSGKLNEDGFDPSDWFLLTTCHETGTVARSFDPATCSKVNELDSFLR
jgi:hypothetical protein